MKIPPAGDAPKQVPSKTVLKSKSHTGAAAQSGFNRLNNCAKVMALYSGKASPLNPEQARHSVQKGASGANIPRSIKP